MSTRLSLWLDVATFWSDAPVKAGKECQGGSVRLIVVLTGVLVEDGVGVCGRDAEGGTMALGAARLST